MSYIDQHPASSLTCTLQVGHLNIGCETKVWNLQRGCHDPCSLAHRLYSCRDLFTSHHVALCHLKFKGPRSKQAESLEEITLHILFYLFSGITAIKKHINNNVGFV